jgi:hypothetical protein
VSERAATGSEARPLWAWLDLAPLVWLLIVILGYGFLAAAAMNVSFKELLKELPPITELDRLAVPFLVLTVCAGIIRYYCVRMQERAGASAPPVPHPQRRDIA